MPFYKKKAWRYYRRITKHFKCDIRSDQSRYFFFLSNGKNYLWSIFVDIYRTWIWWIRFLRQLSEVGVRGEDVTVQVSPVRETFNAEGYPKEEQLFVNFFLLYRYFRWLIGMKVLTEGEKKYSVSELVSNCGFDTGCSFEAKLSDRYQRLVHVTQSIHSLHNHLFVGQLYRLGLGSVHLWPWLGYRRKFFSRSWWKGFRNVRLCGLLLRNCRFSRPKNLNCSAVTTYCRWHSGNSGG